LVDKDLGYHEIGDHGFILVDGIDAFEVFISEDYGRQTS